MKQLGPQAIADFQQTIYDYYHAHGRSFPWRATHDPYHIFVSEIMLQQTQTVRVVAKYEAFIAALPTVADLAYAQPRQVLQLWQGLGYNRRALYLQRAAQEIMQQYQGVVPDNPVVLQELPGIGPNTAGSIVAFAYNKPTVFIETNIRTVFLHHFFKDQSGIHDRQLLPFIEQTLDRAAPRAWYYALMDYGVMLKKNTINPSRRSRHYAKQSTFQGSDRQIRGVILRVLLEHQVCTIAELGEQIDRTPARIAKSLHTLCVDGLVAKHGDSYRVG